MDLKVRSQTSPMTPLFIGGQDSHISVYLRELIAFYPEYGFMIFEGYNNTDKSHIPFKLKLLRLEGSLYLGAYYEITVTESYIKYPGGYPFNPSDKIDRFCTYSRDIIILKFTIDVSEATSLYDWRYCIDGRFKSPNALLKAYMSLMEMPQHTYHQFSVIQDDTEFYKGYNEIKDTPINIYKHTGELKRQIVTLKSGVPLSALNIKTMSNSFYIFNGENHGRLYCDFPIAFFPDEGFVIYQGYTYSSRAQLPFNVQISMNASKTDYNILYDVTVTDFHKKYTEPKPFVKCTCNPSDEDCLCNVSFQPEDIIILKFNINAVHTNAPDDYEWRICVDHRYETPDELLSTYMKLVELPEDRYISIERRAEDAEFYRGYNEIKENYEDIFDADRELRRSKIN